MDFKSCFNASVAVKYNFIYGLKNNCPGWHRSIIGGRFSLWMGLLCIIGHKFCNYAKVVNASIEKELESWTRGKIRSPEGHEDAKKFVTEKLPRISRDFSARVNLFAKYPTSSFKTTDPTDRQSAPYHIYSYFNKHKLTRCFMRDLWGFHDKYFMFDS